MLSSAFRRVSRVGAFPRANVSSFRCFSSSADNSAVKVGFIGLGNVGGKLCGSLVRNGFNCTIFDLDDSYKQDARFFNKELNPNVQWGTSAREMIKENDFLITCLPSPAACAAVMEDAETG